LSRFFFKNEKRLKNKKRDQNKKGKKTFFYIYGQIRLGRRKGGNGLALNLRQSYDELWKNSRTSWNDVTRF